MRPHTRHAPGAGDHVPEAGQGVRPGAGGQAGPRWVATCLQRPWWAAARGGPGACGRVRTTAPPGVGGAVVHQDLACGRIRPGGR